MFFEMSGEDTNDERHGDDVEESAIIEDRHVNISCKIKDHWILVFQIGLSCSTTSPDERMSTNIVVKEMNVIRDTFLTFKRGNRRRMS